MLKRIPLIFLALTAITGCDQVTARLGLENPGLKEARQEAEGKAVGSACRQSGRAIEDCYSIYSWLPKASIFAGWREMDEYMRDNQIETIVPQLPPPQPPAALRGKKKKVAPSEPAAEGGTDAAKTEGSESPAEKSDKPAAPAATKS